MEPSNQARPSPFRSRLAWTFSALYLLAAAVIFREALTCTTIACDLVAIPVALPTGLVLSPLLDWIHFFLPIPTYDPSNSLRDPLFIGLVVTANTLFYFGAGVLLSRWIYRRRRRAHPPETA